MSNISELAFIAEELRHTFVHDLLRYVIGAGGTYLVINLGLSRLLGLSKLQTKTPTPAQFRREVLASFRTVLIFTLFGTSIALMAHWGLNRVYSDAAQFGRIWLWASLGLIVLAHDAWFYWSHRLLHHPRLFRRWHALHHKSKTPTPFTSYAFDWEEAVINAVFLVLWTVLIPMHPLALLIFVIHMMLRNTIGHCGYEVFPAKPDGRPLFGWLTTVTHHDLHHAHGRWNMGLYFTWWDRWMGTEHPDYLASFARVGPRWSLPLREGLLAVGIAIAMFGVPTDARSEMKPGLYVTSGLGIVVRLTPCRSGAEAVCGHVRHGARHLAMPDAKMSRARGEVGWTYRRIEGAGLFRQKGTRLEILACRGSCWRRVGLMSPGLGRLTFMQLQ